jgi:hypothetical protein
MAGKDKSAAKLAGHLNEAIDAACPVSRPGTTAGAAAGAAGGAAGAAAGATTGALLRDGSGAPAGQPIDLGLGMISWLGLGATEFSLTKGDKLFGKPKGEPLARFAYSDVDAVDLQPGKITIRANLAFNDGRTLVFETKNRGPVNKPNVEVLELLKQRCEA